MFYIQCIYLYDRRWQILCLIVLYCSVLQWTVRVLSCTVQCKDNLREWLHMQNWFTSKLFANSPLSTNSCLPACNIAKYNWAVKLFAGPYLPNPAAHSGGVGPGHPPRLGQAGRAGSLYVPDRPRPVVRLLLQTVLRGGGGGGGRRAGASRPDPVPRQRTDRATGRAGPRTVWHGTEKSLETVRSAELGARASRRKDCRKRVPTDGTMMRGFRIFGRSSPGCSDVPTIYECFYLYFCSTMME